MSAHTLEQHQADILAALQVFGTRLGWQAESVVVDEALVYQTPLPNDPDISGVFFVVDADEPNIRLYLTLPWQAPLSQQAEAAEFVIRCGYGRRFGALEYDLEHGSLRVRMDTDATEDTFVDSIARLLDRALTLGRAVSPGWRAVACDGASAADALHHHPIE